MDLKGTQCSCVDSVLRQIIPIVDDSVSEKVCMLVVSRATFYELKVMPTSTIAYIFYTN